MRFIIALAFAAVVLGAVLGLLLRPALGRRRFALLAFLSLLPMVVHALYLAVISWQAGLEPAGLIPFGVLVLVLLAVGGVLARRWTRRAPLLAAFLPLFTGLVYAVGASLLFGSSLRATGVVPNAVASVAYGLVTLALIMMLLVFVPEPVRIDGRKAFPWPWRRQDPPPG